MHSALLIGMFGGTRMTPTINRCRMRHKRTQTQAECTCTKSGADADVAADADIIDDIIDDDVEEEFDSEFDEEDDEAILKAMLLAQEYYLLYGDEGNITSCAKVEHDLMFRQARKDIPNSEFRTADGVADMILKFCIDF